MGERGGRIEMSQTSVLGRKKIKGKQLMGCKVKEVQGQPCGGVQKALQEVREEAVQLWDVVHQRGLPGREASRAKGCHCEGSKQWREEA